MGTALEKIEKARRTWADMTPSEKVAAVIIPLFFVALLTGVSLLVLPPLIAALELWVQFMAIGIPVAMFAMFLYVTHDTLTSWWLGKIEKIRFDIISGNPIAVGRGTIFKLRAIMKRVAESIRKLTVGKQKLEQKIKDRNASIAEAFAEASAAKGVPGMEGKFSNSMARANDLKEANNDTLKDLERIKFFIKVTTRAKNAGDTKIGRLEDKIAILEDRLESSGIAREALSGALNLEKERAYQDALLSIEAAKNQLADNLGTIEQMLMDSQDVLTGQVLKERMDFAQAEAMFDAWERGEEYQPALPAGTVAALAAPTSDDTMDTLNRLLDTSSPSFAKEEALVPKNDSRK